MGDDLAGWAEACDRLAALGGRLGDDDYPGDEADRADGIAHVVEQTLCWMGWSVFHADPRRPSFQRQNDLITQWGGPNADNVYRHTRVDPVAATGSAAACTRARSSSSPSGRGFMHLPTWGTLVEVTATELGIAEGDDFDFVVGDGGHGAPARRRAPRVSIREYYFDWSEAEPAPFTIECLDDDAGEPPARRTAATTAAQLSEGVDGVVHSVEYWNTYMREKAGQGQPNTFDPAFALANGLDAARYAFCFWDLGPDDALVVEVPVPPARYWTFQLYEMRVVRARRRHRPTRVAQPHPGPRRRRRRHPPRGVPPRPRRGELARRLGRAHRAAHLPGVLDDRRRRHSHDPGGARR